MTRTRTAARLTLCTAGVSLLCLALSPAAWAEGSAGVDAAAAAAPPAVKKPAPAPLRAPVPRPAPASRANSGGEDASGASVHLSKAAELYQSGQFDAVVPELEAAYHLNPLPRILCNIAQAYRKGGHPKEAAEQYDLCLRTDPKLTAQERAEFGDYRQQALAELAAAAAAKEPAHREPVQTDNAVAAAPSMQASVPQAEPHRPVYKRAWFWGVIGTVVVAGAVTAGVLVWQLGKPDPLSLLPPDTPLLRF